MMCRITKQCLISTKKILERRWIPRQTFDTELKKFIKSEPKVEPELDSSMLYAEPHPPPATQKPREDPARPSENEDESKKSTAARPRERVASKE